jgi:hypothetical protein
MVPSISIKNDVQTMAYPAGGAIPFILPSRFDPTEEALDHLIQIAGAAERLKGIATPAGCHPVPIRPIGPNLLKAFSLKGCALKVDLQRPARIVERRDVDAKIFVPIIYALALIPTAKL